MSVEMVAALIDIHFRYPGQRRPALQGITLDLPAGTITALLGPNGAGKTSLLHVILGLLRPQQGRVCVAGRPSGGYTRQEMGRLIGLVPQSEHIPFALSVRDYVLLGRAPYLHPLEQPGAADRQAAQEALAAVGAEHLAGRPINALSGGEQQLAMLARALVQQPRLLLLDEPTAHLDLGNRAHILALLRKLRGQGLTIAFSTHDPQAAADCADRVALLRAGRVLAVGAPGETLTEERLTATYGVPVEVIAAQGRRVILV